MNNQPSFIFFNFEEKYSNNKGIDGFIGEMEFVKLCKTKGYIISLADKKTHYDIRVNGKKVDVKSQRSSNGFDDTYNVNVKASQLNAETDAYAFYFFGLGGYSFAGIISRDEFTKKAKLKRKGDVEKTGFVYPVDTYTVKVRDLRTLEEVIG